jgi:hypothetical protein
VAVLADLIRLADSKRQPKGCLTAASPSAEKVIDLMFRIVRLKVPATTRADGIRWMRGQAADVLAELKGTSGGKVPPALLEMLKDKEMPVPLRCKAALALGSLSYEGSVPAAGPYLTALAELADDALGSDQPADRGRVELVSRDVQAGAKPFSASANPNDQVLLDGLLKPMQTLDKEIATAPEELATAMAKAKESLDRLLKKK